MAGWQGGWVHVWWGFGWGSWARFTVKGSLAPHAVGLGLPGGCPRMAQLRRVPWLGLHLSLPQSCSLARVRRIAADLGEFELAAGLKKRARGHVHVPNAFPCCSNSTNSRHLAAPPPPAPSPGLRRIFPGVFSLAGAWGLSVRGAGMAAPLRAAPFRIFWGVGVPLVCLACGLFCGMAI